MNKKQIYRISKYGLFGTFAIIFFFGIIYTGSDGRSSFMENPLTMKVIALCVFLLGIHMLTFRGEWARDNVDNAKRFLRNKPKVIQSWLAFHRSESNAYGMTILIGLAAILWGIMFFVFALKR